MTIEIKHVLIPYIPKFQLGFLWMPPVDSPKISTLISNLEIRDEPSIDMGSSVLFPASEEITMTILLSI